MYVPVRITSTRFVPSSKAFMIPIFSWWFRCLERLLGMKEDTRVNRKNKLLSELAYINIKYNVHVYMYTYMYIHVCTPICTYLYLHVTYMRMCIVTTRTSD